MIRLDGHSDVYSLAFSPSMPLLVSGDYSGETKLWNLDLNTHVDLMPSRNVQCYNAATASFSLDGTRLATAAVHDGDFLRIWDVFTLQPMITQFDTPEITSIAWSPDGKSIACASYDLILIGSDTGRVIKQLSGFPEFLTSVAWSPDGRYVAGGTNLYSPTIMVWSIENFQLHATLPKDIPDGLNTISQMVFQSPEKLTFIQDYGIVRVWDIATDTVTTLFDPEWKYPTELDCQIDHCCAISPDGQLVAYAMAVGKPKSVKDEHGTTGIQIEQVEGWPLDAVYVVDITSQEILNIYEGHAEMTTAMAFNQKRDLLATGDIIGELYVWKLAESKPPKKQ